MRPGRAADQFSLRLPDGMRDRIKTAAAANGRTMNAEIVHQLTAYEAGPMNGEEMPTKSATLTIRLTAELRAKLDALAMRGPYRLSVTSIVERGIELAVQELERMNGRGAE